MKKFISLLSLAALAICLAGCGSKTEETVESPDTGTEHLLEQSILLMDQMKNGEFEGTYDIASDSLKEALPKEQLAMAFASVFANQKFSGYSDQIISNTSDMTIVTITSQLSTMLLKTNFVYNTKEQLAGINFLPAPLNPPVFENDTIKEIEILTGSDGRLNGRLTIPKNVENPPVAIMLQGSGSSGMDEVIGTAANAPFRDIAHGLAERGVASIRYDKRFYAYPQEAVALQMITLEDEYFNDLKAAIELAKTDNHVDNSRIFVIGHSLGGMIAPAISSMYPELSGVISMAGSPRYLEDILLDQTIDGVKIAGIEGEQANAQISAVEAEVKAIKELDEKTSDLSAPLLGAAASYWLSCAKYNPIHYCETMTMPFLIMQGSADCQISVTKDYEEFKKYFKGKTNTTFKLYDNLNHLFMPSIGSGYADEYNLANQVAEEPLEDMADWIKSISKH